jgi:hypothetical protein
MNNYDYKIQELWDTVKRPNLRIHKVEEGAEMQTKIIGNMLTEIIAKNFPSLCNDIDTNVQRILYSKQT